MTTAEPGTRRTQAQRTAQMRRALIEATIASIRDAGYHATTNRSVAELSGASLGAMSHHFANRNELIASALDEVGNRVITELGERAAAITATGTNRIRGTLDVLWTLFSGDLFQVWLKVWFAAADDPELYAALAPIERRLSDTIATEIAKLTPPHLDRKSWVRRVGVAMDAIRGLALTQQLEPRRPERGRDRWPTVRSELLRMIEC
ncbi:TetR/AcrR family transcriptional regulator [Nocardia sp. NPDC059239]|uniref:TetR/AcrR family transcriptional regulator n=1 Tax=unclassified Nocardia TaxID=2637762 RepID=UPI003696EA92